MGGNPNDPWGNNNRGGNKNRGGGNQPPDIDEAVKQLMDKLNGLFGGGKRNNNNGGGNKSGGTGGIFGILVAILVVFLGFQSVYTLDEQERGVVLRLGKYLETKTRVCNLRSTKDN